MQWISTWLIQCPFSVIRLYKDDQWYLDVQNRKHNHINTTTPSAYSVHQHFSITTRQKIADLSCARTQLQEILLILRIEDPKLPI